MSPVRIPCSSQYCAGTSTSRARTSFGQSHAISVLGASAIIAVESDPVRSKMARTMGADSVIDPSKKDPVHEIMNMTGGRGVDVAIEALGIQQTFESALRVVKPGGKLSSLGVYSGKLDVPLDAFGAGIADIQILTTLCPGGKERMRRLMELVASKRLNVRQLLTHDFTLDQIGKAYEVFGNRREGVMKVAIRNLK